MLTLPANLTEKQRRLIDAAVHEKLRPEQRVEWRTGLLLHDGDWLDGKGKMLGPCVELVGPAYSVWIPVPAYGDPGEANNELAEAMLLQHSMHILRFQHKLKEPFYILCELDKSASYPYDAPFGGEALTLEGAILACYMDANHILIPEAEKEQ